MPRICIINQRLYIVYVRLATNLLQITEFTIKHPGKKQVYSGRSCPELGLDTSRPIMYVLPYNSKADLLTLRAQCLAHDLPDPLEPLEIDGTLLPRYVFIHGGPRVFTYYTPKKSLLSCSTTISICTVATQIWMCRRIGASIGDVWSRARA
ncbi:hypothetical protein ACLB1R_29335 [Escherichia coli]